MIGYPPPRRVFLIAGWRRWLMPAMFGTFAAGGLALALVDDPGARAAGGFVALLMLACVGFGEWLIRFTRLEVSADGIDLRQLGYRLRSPWPNVVGWYGRPGRQGFVLAEPLTGKGPDRLAFASGTLINGSPLYDTVQGDLLSQRRFVPVDAFDAHAARGTLAAAVRPHAPRLADAMAAAGPPWAVVGPAGTDPGAPAWAPPVPPPVAPMPRSRQVLTWGLVVALIAGSAWVAVTEPPWAAPAISALLAVAVALGAAGSLYGAWAAARARQWLWLALYVAQSVFALFALVLTLAGDGASPR